MLFHEPNESRRRAALVYRDELTSRLDNPDPPPYQQEYNISSTRQRILEFLRGANSWQEHKSNIWENNCYYCNPSGRGTNDPDVIVSGPCDCWCHEEIEPRKLLERLEEVILS